MSASNPHHAIDQLCEALVTALIAYDKTGDHQHNGSPIPGDCIRCNVIEALPNTFAARVNAARMPASRKSAFAAGFRAWVRLGSDDVPHKFMAFSAAYLAGFEAASVMNGETCHRPAVDDWDGPWMSYALAVASVGVSST